MISFTIEAITNVDLKRAALELLSNHSHIAIVNLIKQHYPCCYDGKKYTI